MPRRFLIAIVALVLLLFFSSVPAPIALGQEKRVANDPTSEQHWIVSTRHCSTECKPCELNCAFAYGFADWCGNSRGSDEATFRRWVRPGVPICIYVHGSFVPEDTVVSDSTSTFRWVRGAAPQQAVQVVSFTWKSNGVFTLDPAVAASSLVPGLDVAILGKRAEAHGVHLAQFLLSLPEESPVCVIGHSHGARIVASALDLLGGGCCCGVRLTNGPSGRRVRAIFAAAGIDHDWLNPGEKYGRAMCGADCVLNLKAPRDWALALYPLRKPFSKRALGAAGFTKSDIRKLGSAASRIAEVDVTKSIGKGHIWPYYTNRPELAEMLREWLYSQPFE